MLVQVVGPFLLHPEPRLDEFEQYLVVFSIDGEGHADAKVCNTATSSGPVQITGV